MKHIQITNLDQFTAVFSGETLKRKRELLAEAALLSVVALSKDKQNATKLAKSLDEFADEIYKEAILISRRLERAIETTQSATDDFATTLRQEALRLRNAAALEPVLSAADRIAEAMAGEPPKPKRTRGPSGRYEPVP